MDKTIRAAQPGASSRQGRSHRNGSAIGPKRDLVWIPIALGTAAIVAGLGSRRDTMPLALTTIAGVAAGAAARNVQYARGSADSREERGASGADLVVERSITVGRTADELRQCWLDPTTLPRITAGFATVRASGDGRMHWRVEGPLRQTLEWDSETVEDAPGQGIGWRSLPNAALSNQASIRFHPAPAGRGTVVSLQLRIDPPGGPLGNAAAKLFGTTPLDLAVDGALRRFKSLAETGEIPTTERQPAARADTR